MNTNVSIISSVCQVARAEGFPKKQERRLEARVSTILDHEGPAGVIAYFKALQKCKLQSLSSGTISNTHWISFNRKKTMPKNTNIRTLWNLSPAKFFAVSGAVMMSITTPVNSRSINDWYRDQSQNPLPSGVDDDGLIPFVNGTSQTFSVAWPDVQSSVSRWVRAGSLTWTKIATHLFEHDLRSSQLPFSPSDVTKSAIPTLEGVKHLQFKQEGRQFIADKDQLLSLYRQSQIDAPDSIMGPVSRDDASLARLALLLNGRYGVQVAEGTTTIETYLSDLQQHKLTGFGAKAQYSSSEEKNYNSPHFSKFGQSTRPDVTPSKYSRTQNDIVGSISFLPKPGGKLRVVANPNRRLQKSIDSLGTTIQDVVYGSPELGGHIFVMNQDQGRIYVKDQLKSNTPLASIDLHAATDTIDYGRALDLTGYTYWKKYMHDRIGHGEELLDSVFDSFEMKANTARYHSDPKILGPMLPKARDSYTSNDIADMACAYLVHRMDAFDKIRTGSWKLDTDVKTTPVEYTSFLKGQPLGTRPSFPLLTFANAMAAYLSVKDSGHQAYAIIGDDAVIDAHAYSRYKEIMSSFLGSEVNDDKTLTSSSLAEFAGYMETRNKVFPKKPRFSESKVGNALKFGTDIPWLKDEINRAASAMVMGQDTISNLPYPDKPLQARLATSKSSVKNRILAKAGMDIVSDLPEPKAEITQSGSSLTDHIEAGRNSYHKLQSYHVDRPEEYISNISYDVRLHFFDHHDMSQHTVQDSLYAYLHKKARMADLVDQLTQTGTAIAPFKSEDGQDVGFLLLDQDGSGALVTNHQWKDVKLTSSLLEKVASGQLGNFYSSTPIVKFRQGVMRHLRDHAVLNTYGPTKISKDPVREHASTKASQADSDLEL